MFSTVLSDYNVPGQSLPHTGFDLWLPLLAFAVLVVIGVILKLAAR